MASAGEKLFLGMAMIIIALFLTGPSRLRFLFAGESLTGAFAAANVRAVLQAPWFWIILFILLCVLVYLTSRKK